MESFALRSAALLAIVLLGLPLSFSPLGWARVVGWKLPDESDLAVYFGRCLGAVVLVLCALALHASFHPETRSAALASTAGGMLLMVPVHVAGAVRKTQPRFETYEIPVYLLGGLFFLWLSLR